MSRKLELGAVMTLLALANACTSWQPIQLPPQAFPAGEGPKSVRITTSTGPRRILQRPWSVNDSIFGSGDTGRRCDAGLVGCVASGSTVGVATDDVTRLEVRRFDGGRTLVLVATLFFAKLIYDEATAPPKRFFPVNLGCISC